MFVVKGVIVRLEDNLRNLFVPLMSWVGEAIFNERTNTPCNGPPNNFSNKPYLEWAWLEFFQMFAWKLCTELYPTFVGILFRSSKVVDIDVTRCWHSKVFAHRSDVVLFSLGEVAPMFIAETYSRKRSAWDLANYIGFVLTYWVTSISSR